MVEGLRSAIISGELAGGQRVVEADLCARFNVGRAAIRNALLELSTQGLIEREPNRGARVRTFTFDEAKQIAEVRMLVEGLCAAKAAERATKKEAAGLKKIVKEMATKVRQGDLLGYSDLNTTLHRVILEMAGQPVATNVVEQLRSQAARHQFRVALIPGRTQTSLKEHEAIVDAIAAGDARRASAAMHQHLQSVIDALEGVDPADYVTRPTSR